MREWAILSGAARIAGVIATLRSSVTTQIRTKVYSRKRILTTRLALIMLFSYRTIYIEVTYIINNNKGYCKLIYTFIVILLHESNNKRHSYIHPYSKRIWQCLVIYFFHNNVFCCFYIPGEGLVPTYGLKKIYNTKHSVIMFYILVSGITQFYLHVTVNIWNKWVLVLRLRYSFCLIM